MAPLYIDALIATQAGPDGPDGDFTDASTFDTLYAICDRKYDVIAMTRPDGALAERTDYTPYGVARHRPRADINGDGAVDGTDQLILINIWGASLGDPGYNPDADINSDGVVNGADLFLLNNDSGAPPAPAGAISKLGNTVGYSGYIHDDAIGLSLARFRWFDAETGRWATRDPAGYVDGSSAYLYGQSSPLANADPFGLHPTVNIAIIDAIAAGFSAKEIAAMFSITVIAAQALIDDQSLANRANEILHNISRNPKGKNKCEQARNNVKRAERSIKNIQKQIEDHQRKITDPHGYGKLPCDVDPRQKDGTVRKWKK